MSDLEKDYRWTVVFFYSDGAVIPVKGDRYETYDTTVKNRCAAEVERLNKLMHNVPLEPYMEYSQARDRHSRYLVRINYVAADHHPMPQGNPFPLDDIERYGINNE